MKKLILLIAMLSLSTAGLVGCNNGKTRGMDLSTPENVSEIVQIEQTADCEDGDCKEPDCPDCLDEQPDDENKIPEPPHGNDKERREKHERHGSRHDHGCPRPRPMPRQPK